MYNLDTESSWESLSLSSSLSPLRILFSFEIIQQKLRPNNVEFIFMLHTDFGGGRARRYGRAIQSWQIHLHFWPIGWIIQYWLSCFDRYNLGYLQKGDFPFFSCYLMIILNFWWFDIFRFNCSTKYIFRKLTVAKKMFWSLDVKWLPPVTLYMVQQLLLCCPLAMPHQCSC